MAAGARRRLLPAWMGAAGDEQAAAAPSRAGQRRRRQAAAGPRGAAAVHCMNEAELVDVALVVLAENLQCQEDEEKARSRREEQQELQAATSEEEQELQPTPKEAPGSTASVGGGSDHSLALPSPPDARAGADAKKTGWEDSEDDVLKYVREIFFS